MIKKSFNLKIHCNLDIYKILILESNEIYHIKEKEKAKNNIIFYDDDYEDNLLAQMVEDFKTNIEN